MRPYMVKVKAKTVSSDIDALKSFRATPLNMASMSNETKFVTIQ